MSWSRLGLGSLLVVAVLAAGLRAEDAATGADKAKLEKAISAGANFLAKAQAKDGSFNDKTGPAVTALVATALMRNGRSPADPTVAAALKYIEGYVQEDGGIHKKDSAHKNYETSLALVCMVEANKDGRYNDTIKKADAFLKGLIWDGGEGHDESSTNYGGAGYGGHKRPDLSNTNFLLDALKAAGNDADDEAVKKALVFVSRCQNLETENNTTPFAAKNPDGGFYYTPAAGGSSQAGETETGGLRSYGSMTYAGLKSMIFAGVGPDDPRVKAATKWLQKNYSLEQNPGMGNAGLFYYYHTFAKALDAVGKPTFEDETGVKHDWRRELVDKLAAQQQPDGSWLNENSRWMEGEANLVTAYALLALSYCK